MYVCVCVCLSLAGLYRLFFRASLDVTVRLHVFVSCATDVKIIITSMVEAP